MIKYSDNHEIDFLPICNRESQKGAEKIISVVVGNNSDILNWNDCCNCGGNEIMTEVWDAHCRIVRAEENFNISTGYFMFGNLCIRSFEIPLALCDEKAIQSVCWQLGAFKQTTWCTFGGSVIMSWYCRLIWRLSGIFERLWLLISFLKLANETFTLQCNLVQFTFIWFEDRIPTIYLQIGSRMSVEFFHAFYSSLIIFIRQYFRHVKKKMKVWKSLNIFSLTILTFHFTLSLLL